MISVEQEVTAQGLPAELWRPLLAGRPPLSLSSIDVDTPVTVVVPHPDDETLGAGGLLHRLGPADGAAGARIGALVSVVFVTDGAAGYPGCTSKQADQLVRIRRVEARTALSTLGLAEANVHFLDLPDGEVSAAEPDLADRLTELLGPPANGLCLAPWPDDPHPDHQAVGRAARLAADRTGTRLWQYPIWMRHSIRPDDPVIDVDRLRVLRLSPAEQVAKRIAIETHASQLRSPFAGYGPVLPDHVLELFEDGLEPFFLPGDGTAW